MGPSPHNVSFYAWYGNWKGVLVVSAVVVTFILGFLVAPLLDVSPLAFGMKESHLWAYLLDRAQVLPPARGVYVVMVVSLALRSASIRSLPSPISTRSAGCRRRS